MNNKTYPANFPDTFGIFSRKEIEMGLDEIFHYMK